MIIFLISHQNHICDPSSEPSHQNSSGERSQHMFHRDSSDKESQHVFYAELTKIIPHYHQILPLTYRSVVSKANFLQVF